MSALAEPVAPATSRPGNVTVRELAATLSKSAPPQSPTPEDAPVETPPAAEVVPAATPPSETPPPAESPPSESPQTEQPETPPETEVPPGETPPSEAEPARASLPPELTDAIELAKGDGKKGVAELLKRVHTTVDQRDTERNARLAAEEKNRQLEADLAEARKSPPQSEAPVPAGQNPEVARVVKQIGNVDKWLNWCDENPDGGKVPDGAGGELDLDRAGVYEARRGLERQRQELVAEKVQVQTRAKEAFQADYAAAHATAQKSYPELFKQDSPEAKLGAELLRLTPELKRYADYEIIVGRYINGCKLELARQKAASGAPRKVTPAREPALVPSEAPGPSPGKINGSNKEVQETEAAFRRSGKTSDLARWNAAKARAQRART